MPFTIPDQGIGDSNLQSLLWSEEIGVLLAGISGVDCVLAGCAVTGSAGMTPSVAKGAVLSNKVMFAVAAATVTITTADATNPRLDLIVVTSAGALAVRAGTPAAYVEGTSAPKPPVRTANDVVLAIVYVPANDTVIATSQCIDKRVMRENGPICIYRTTTAETTNTAGTVELLNKANSGVTIPDGLFLAGDILRLRMGGNMLLNSGAGTTNAIAIRYGAVTMYSAVESVAQLASATRSAWFIDVDIVAQGNADQSMNGVVSFGDWTITRTAPATGIGFPFQNTSAFEQPPAISGAGTADSNTANRLLSVLWTMTSNVANEVVVEFATLEII